MGQRRLGQVAIDNLKRWGRLPETVDDGGGNLPADGVGAEHAGVDMEEFHLGSPWYKFVTSAT